MKVKNVIYQEAKTTNNSVKVGILIYTGEGDPVKHLNEAVHYYVGTNGYNEFIDANMDNPWVRVIIKGINDMDQEPFDSEKHHL